MLAWEPRRRAKHLAPQPWRMRYLGTLRTGSGSRWVRGWPAPQRCLLVGGTGSGKSAALRFVTLDLVDETRS